MMLSIDDGNARSQVLIELGSVYAMLQHLRWMICGGSGCAIESLVSPSCQQDGHQIVVASSRSSFLRGPPRLLGSLWCGPTSNLQNVYEWEESECTNGYG